MPSVRERATLGEAFDPQRNSLNFLRYVLALGVIVSHAYVFMARPEGPPAWGGGTLGHWCLSSFFLMSGVLITASRFQRSASRYWWDRFLRLVPGIATVLVVTAFVFAPLSTVLGAGHWEPGSSVTYVLRNLFTLYAPLLNQNAIESTLLIPGQAGGLAPWNFSLWSIFLEVCCYAGIGVLVSVVPRRWVGPLVVAAAVLLTGLALITEIRGVSFIIDLAVPATLAFVVGSALWIYRDRVPAGPVALALSIAWLIVASTTDLALAITPLALGIVVIRLGDLLPFHKFGRKRDMTYGVYIYGMPVQMLLIVAAQGRGIEMSMPVNLALMFPLVAAFGWMSFTLVEGPAMQLRRREPWFGLFTPGRFSPRRLVPAGVAVGLVMFGGTAAAAAANQLPPRMQVVVSDVLGQVGIDVPMPELEPAPIEAAKTPATPAPTEVPDGAAPADERPTDPSTREPGRQPTVPVGPDSDRQRPDDSDDDTDLPKAPVPDLPKAPVPDLPKVPVPDVPDVPDVQIPDVSELKAPDVSELKAPDVSELKAPPVVKDGASLVPNTSELKVP